VKKPILLLTAIILVITSGISASWLLLGYWWNPFSPCKLTPERSSRGINRSSWLAPLGTDVITNQGKVCFYPAHDSNPPARDLRVQVYSSGCYSSSCSLVYERTGQMKIDQAAFVFQIYSRFKVKPLDSLRMGVACACTGDCEGAGLLEYETGTLQDGIYQVYMGETLVGALTLPFTQHNLCLDTDHPLEIRQSLPNPYPTPGENNPPPYP
jgi:hypothetical protein